MSTEAIAIKGDPEHEGEGAPETENQDASQPVFRGTPEDWWEAAEKIKKSMQRRGLLVTGTSPSSESTAARRRPSLSPRPASHTAKPVAGPTSSHMSRMKYPNMGAGSSRRRPLSLRG